MGRVLGLDPGTRRCGVALSDSARTMAFPREALVVDDALIGAVVALVGEEGVDEVVVGRPVSLAGSSTASTALAEELAQRLGAALDGVVVVTHDERLTTVQAQRNLTGAGRSAKDQRSRIDSAAAVVLLESYLEAGRA